MIKLLCEKCGTPLIAPDQFAGKKGKCRKCGHLNLIPATSAVTAGAAKPAPSPEALVETMLAPDAVPLIPSPVGTGVLGEPSDRPRRRNFRPLLLSLVWVVAIIAAAYFAWPYAWERLHASDIFSLRAQALVLINRGDLRDGIAKYDALLQLAGNRRIQSKMLSIEIAKARAERADAVARRTGTSSTQPPVRTVSVAGSVSVAWAGAPAQPLAGVRVYALRPKVRRDVIIEFYSGLVKRIQDDEANARDQASQWQHKVTAGTLNPSDLQQWQQYATQDSRQAALYHALALKVAGMARDLLTSEDLAHARLGMLEADHYYAIVSGRAQPGSDFTGDVLDGDFTSIVTATRVASSTTDPSGRFAMLEVPEGPCYIYAFWNDGHRTAEWLLPATIGPNGDTTINLTLQNAAASNNTKD